MVLFKNEKLVAPEISQGGNFAYDEKGEFYSTTTIYGYIKKSDTKESYKCLIAILNSQLFWWYLVNTGTVLANGYFRYKPNYIKPFPLPQSIPNDIETSLVKLVDKILAAKRNLAHEDCTALEESINKIIYGLYELTVEETDWIKQV